MIANTSNFEKTVQKNTCLAECQAYADVTEPVCEPVAVSQNIFKLTDKITNKSNSNTLPDHLVDLVISGSKLLSETQTLQFQRLLQKHSNAFAKSKNDLGCTDMIQHKINTGNAAPVKQNPRRLPVAMQEEADRELSRMLDAGVIEPSTSPWAAPIVLVRKKDGSVRYCIVFRKINSLTKRDSYPLLRTQDCLQARHGSWYSTIDLQSGYWQIPVNPVDSAFVTKQGLFQFRQIPFGLCNAGACFERPCIHCTHCNRQDSKEKTNNDLDTVDCQLRVTKKADISKLQGEEIEFNNSEQSNQWVHSKNTDEITEAQQDDQVIKLIWKMKSESNEKPKWEEISSKDDLDEGDSEDPAAEPEIEKANITRKSTRDTKPPKRYSPSN
ncbi:unnamed protein product [Mytilus coruscus]|uniref:Reverse transcriptase domain-containing protein n=1 Tax=Mytilus coruscus TaxID=42192 RepID=A0A6J8EHM7_MYTCO|nr:unnamed protein product [Mytilus coruscus]